MAQIGFTPIQLYRTTTASATPTAGDLSAGELALNLTDEKLYFKNTAGTVKLLASNAGSSGSVTSVAATVPSFLSVAGSPITTSGTLAISYSGTALPIANGGTAATTANAALNNLMGYTTTATAAGTTTLTAASAYKQYFTGTTTQTVVMPDVTTLALGRSYEIVNNSTGALTVNSSGGNLITTISSGITGVVTCIAITGTTAASWHFEFSSYDNGPAGLANLTRLTSTATAAGTTTLTNASNYFQLFTGTTTQTIVLPVTSTLQTGWTFHIINNSTGVLTVNSSGGNLVISVPAGVTTMCTCIGTTLTTAADWEAGLTDFSTVTGTGSVVLSASPTLTGTASVAALTASGVITGNGNWVLGNADTDTITQAASYVTGTQLKSAKTATNTLNLAAYDVDGAAYTNLVTLTAGNTPTLALTSTGTGTINNMSIGATTASSGAFTTLTSSSGATIEGLTVGLGAGAVTTNTAVGSTALAANTTGSYNTAIGTNALSLNQTGTSNVAVGNSALGNNTTGNENTAIGVSALYLNDSGSYNVAIGRAALNTNNTGSSNTAIGYDALFANQSGNYNTANGFQALSANTIGESNTANGYWALYNNDTGSNNAASGSSALYSNTIGNSNTASGSSALFSNTEGNFNVALGHNALSSSTTGSYNFAFGANAGSDITTGDYNVVIGGYTGSTAPISQTGSSWIVLSDGAGNVRQAMDSTSVQSLTGAAVVYAPAPAATISAATTLTNAQILPQIVVTSGTSFTLTMPVGSTLETLVAWAGTNLGFEFSIINTASGTITLDATETGVTSVGTMTVLTGISARFRIRRTAANTFIVYRLS